MDLGLRSSTRVTMRLYTPLSYEFVCVCVSVSMNGTKPITPQLKQTLGGSAVRLVDADYL